MKRFDYITVLRAVAILLVLVVHVRQHSNGVEYIHPYLIALMDNGARGVQLFYLLSAFTLFRSFNYRKSKEIEPVTNYFIRRFFRIAPLYYLAIIYYLWQDGLGPRYWLGDASHISAGNILSNFTFINGFSPYWINSIVPGGWSVAIEVIFYCFLPFLVTHIKNVRQAVTFTLITLVIRFMLLIFFSRYYFITDHRLWGDYLFLYLPNQLPIFALGIILYFLIYNNETVKMGSTQLLIAFIMIIVGISIPQLNLLPEVFYFGLAFLLLTIALHDKHVRILSNSILKYIGNISYTLYLSHLAVLYFFTKFKLINLVSPHNEPTALANFLMNYISVFFFSIGIATVLHFGIERPMQNFGRKLISRRTSNSGDNIV